MEIKRPLKFYQFLKENNYIVFEAIVGSHSHGTAVETSDIDQKFVYVLPKEEIYGLNYIEQLNVNKDFVGYEIGRFLQLLEKANPTVLELLFSPKDCIVYKNDVFDILTKEKNRFLTKRCKISFGGYARQQIIKATGQNKMMNWEKSKIQRKTPLDFCYAIDGEKSYKLKNWLKRNKMSQCNCGLVNVPNAKEVYALFYDWNGILNYKGIVKEDKKGEVLSNELRLSSIPKGFEPSVIIHYNKDGYTSHCKDYKKYQNWLKNRNINRWIDVKNKEQKIDGKNMLHCIRLIEMAEEIANGNGLNVRRNNADELIKIRRGEKDLAELVAYVNEKIKAIDKLFDESDLPDSVDYDFINNLLIKIRKIVYGED